MSDVPNLSATGRRSHPETLTPLFVKRRPRIVIAGTALLVFAMLAFLAMAELWPRFKLKAVVLGMSERQVATVLGSPLVAGLESEPGFPWPKTVGLRVLTGQADQFAQVNSYSIGINEYWIYFDAAGKVSGIAEALDT